MENPDSTDFSIQKFIFSLNENSRGGGVVTEWSHQGSRLSLRVLSAPLVGLALKQATRVVSRSCHTSRYHTLTACPGAEKRAVFCVYRMCIHDGGRTYQKPWSRLPLTSPCPDLDLMPAPTPSPARKPRWAQPASDPANVAGAQVHLV